MRNKIFSILTIIFAAAILTAALIFQGYRPVVAQAGTTNSPEPDSISFEMMGIAAGQTARINIFNANSLDYESHPCPSIFILWMSMAESYEGLMASRFDALLLFKTASQSPLN